MKYFNTYEKHSYNKLGHRNQEVRDNNWVGSQGHTFNHKEPAKSIKDAEKMLKDQGITWDSQFETRDGWIHYRKDVSWTNYQVGIDPRTNKPYTGSMSVAAYNSHEKMLWTEPTDMMKDYTKDPHLTEARSTMNKKEILSIVNKVYPKIIKNLGKGKEGIAKVEVHNNIYARVSGIEGSEGEANPHAQYERHVNTIYLYTPRMTDEEQVIRSLLHEYTHSLQDPKNKEKHRKLRYDKNPDEIEAHKAEENWKKYL